jgi:hypothetical protein
MTVNPAGAPPAPPTPLVAQPDASSPVQDPNARDNDRGNNRRRYWEQGNPDVRNAQQPTPRTPTIQQPTVTAPNVVPNTDAIDTSDAGRVYVPRQTGNTGSMPGDGNGFNRFQRPNPTGVPPQMPTQPQAPQPVQQPMFQQPAIQQPVVTTPQAISPPMTGNSNTMPDTNSFRYRGGNPAGMPPTMGGGRYGQPTPVAPSVTPTPMPQPVMPSAPMAQPQFTQPAFQHPATPPPQQPAAAPPTGNVFIPGVGNVPANVGRGNFGQGNAGSGNTGQ